MRIGCFSNSPSPLSARLSEPLEEESPRGVGEVRIITLGLGRRTELGDS